MEDGCNMGAHLWWWGTPVCSLCVEMWSPAPFLGWPGHMMAHYTDGQMWQLTFLPPAAGGACPAIAGCSGLKASFSASVLGTHTCHKSKLGAVRRTDHTSKLGAVTNLSILRIPFRRRSAIGRGGCPAILCHRVHVVEDEH